MDYFPQAQYVQNVIDELALTPEQIQAIKTKYASYANDIYAIPVTIWATPTPYSPLRINTQTKHLYVPNKAKLISTMRELILKEIGPNPFMTGFFPRFSETILHTSLYIPTPQAFNKESVYLAEIKILRPIVTPDLDNVLKIINDGIKSFIIYDDAQIVTTISDKYYSRKPRIEATIIYNASSMSTIHQKLMEQRKSKWQKQLVSQKPPAMVALLRKFYTI
jgi:Holliday junction resolvase RusA-like endonuclease